MSNGKTKSIEDIQVGESIKSYDETTGEIVSRPVEKAIHHETKIQQLYTFSYNNESVTSNDIHPFYLPKEQRYQQASEIYDRWMNGEEIEFLDTNKQRVRVTKIVHTSQNVPVYNLHITGKYDANGNVTDNHNYFVNDVLVHNKNTAIDNQLQ
jgi:hypothetical protein